MKQVYHNRRSSWEELFLVLRDHAQDIFTYLEARDAWDEYGSVSITQNKFTRTLNELIKKGLVRKIEDRLYYRVTAAELERARYGP